MPIWNEILVPIHVVSSELMVLSFSHQVKAAREHARLKDAKEESSGEESAIVGHDALHSSGKAEKTHVQREPYVGSEALKQDVAGDFEYHI